MSTTNHFESFTTWAQLMDHVSAGYPLWYQAPLDYTPRQITAFLRRDHQIRVTPTYTDADPFTADAGHLSRFRRQTAHRTTA